MRKIKKRELIKLRSKEEKEVDGSMDELVDLDGSPIEGDKNMSNDSEIETAPQQTTDDFAQSGIQPNNFFYGSYGVPYSRGTGHLTLESRKKAINIIEKIIKNKLNG